MKISFFEEYPTEENLAKIKLISWPTKLYLAASSLDEFQKIKKQIKNKNVKEIVYWPILAKHEGYWISPFSNRKALLRVFEELWGKKIPIMLDLELPSKTNPKLYLKSLLNFKHNKSLIKNFINNYKGEIHLAEYYPEGKFKGSLLKLWGLHYNNNDAKIIKMMYHSMHNFTTKRMENECKLGSKLHGKNFCVALGTIATGINGNEPLLSGTQLQKDLEIAKKSGIKESVIFRLGGLEKQHLELIKPTKKSVSKNKEDGALLLVS